MGSLQLWPGIGSGPNSFWQHVFSGTDRPSEKWHHEIPRHPYLFLRDLQRNNIIQSNIKNIRFKLLIIIPSALASLDFSGLRHSTVGRRFKRSRVRASGSVLSSAPYQRCLCSLSIH